MAPFARTRLSVARKPDPVRREPPMVANRWIGAAATSLLTMQAKLAGIATAHTKPPTVAQCRTSPTHSELWPVRRRRRVSTSVRVAHNALTSSSVADEASQPWQPTAASSQRPRRRWPCSQHPAQQNPRAPAADSDRGRRRGDHRGAEHREPAGDRYRDDYYGRSSWWSDLNPHNFHQRCCIVGRADGTGL